MLLKKRITLAIWIITGYGTILFTLAGCAVAFAGVLILVKKSKKEA